MGKLSKYNIIDSHAHYDDEAFNEDRETVIRELKENGVTGIINCGASFKGLVSSLELAEKYDFFYAALGIHPEHADEYNQEVEGYIRKAISNPKVKAIGEIGLDYYWEENPPKEVQQKVFREQLDLAREFKLPVVIHDRDAHGDTLEILKEFPEVTGVIHCFSGSVEFAMECLKLGYYIGFTGVVTFKNAKKILEVAKVVPLDRILVETDCPYMAPAPNRGKRNRSDYIEYIIEKLSEIKEMDPIELNMEVNKNITRLFKL